MNASANEKYDSLTILFHSVTAALVFALWAVGKTADFFPRGPWRAGYWSVHFTLGLLLIVVIVARLGWRFTRGVKLPDVNEGLLRVASKGMHHLLYLLLVVVCALGIANAFVRGVGVFGLVAFPKLIDAAAKGPISEAHEWSANLLLFLAIGHAAAAIYHHVVAKDGVLLRMSARG